MVCVTGDDGTVRLRRLGDSYPDWELLRDGGYSRVRAATVGRLSDGAPVIVTGGDDGTVRVWRLADTTLSRTSCLVRPVTLRRIRFPSGPKPSETAPT